METISGRSSVTAYVDPSCPFAWIAARWLLEVSELRPLDLHFELMSLSVVNEGRELEPWYRDFNDRAWGPARVCAAAVSVGGEVILDRLYPALGRRIHDQGVKDLARVLPEALAEAGLPTDLADRTGDTSLDDALRDATREAQELVGGALGTPIIRVDEGAFFGPVLSSVPRGEEALRILDGMRLLAGSQAFSELKRDRCGELSFV